jgi:hypothetical protein
VRELEFLCLDCAADAVPTSPLSRALAHAEPGLGLRDLSLEVAKLDVRGADVEDLDVEGDVVRTTPERALVFSSAREIDALRTRLRQSGCFVIDMTGALAGLELRGETLMRRLTDLDLDALPAVGSFAHVPATVLRGGDDTFRVFFPQEYGHYVTEVVIDTAEGLA